MCGPNFGRKLETPHAGSGGRGGWGGGVGWGIEGRELGPARPATRRWQNGLRAADARTAPDWRRGRAGGDGDEA